MEDFNNKRRNGTFVYAADYRDPVDFEYYFDQMSVEVGSAELSLREVMDELYSLIADISRSCPNPMTEPFELPDDNHYGYDKQHKDKKETINAYHKELIIICSKLPGFLSKLYNVYQNLSALHRYLTPQFFSLKLLLVFEAVPDCADIKLEYPQLQKPLFDFLRGIWRISIRILIMSFVFIV